MRVACPGCKSEYNVDEGRIPADGLNMKCPRCASIFAVQRPAPVAAPVALPGTELEPDLDDGQDWEFDPSAPTDHFPAPASRPADDPFARAEARARDQAWEPPPLAGGTPPPASSRPSVPLPPSAPRGAPPPPPQLSGGAVPLPSSTPPAGAKSGAPAQAGGPVPLPPPPTLGAGAPKPPSDGAIPLPPPPVVGTGAPKAPAGAGAAQPPSDGAIPLPPPPVMGTGAPKSPAGAGAAQPPSAGAIPLPPPPTLGGAPATGGAGGPQHPPAGAVPLPPPPSPGVVVPPPPLAAADLPPPPALDAGNLPPPPAPGGGDVPPPPGLDADDLFSPPEDAGGLPPPPALDANDLPPATGLDADDLFSPPEGAGDLPPPPPLGAPPASDLPPAFGGPDSAGAPSLDLDDDDRPAASPSIPLPPSPPVADGLPSLAGAEFAPFDEAPFEDDATRQMERPPEPPGAFDFHAGDLEFGELPPPPEAPPATAVSGIELDPATPDPIRDFLEASLGPSQGEKRYLVRRSSGKTFGPFPLEELKQMLTEGRLLGNEEVSLDADRWVAISGVEGLQGVQPPAPAAPVLEAADPADAAAEAERPSRRPAGRKVRLAIAGGAAALALGAGGLYFLAPLEGGSTATTAQALPGAAEVKSALLRADFASLQGALAQAEAALETNANDVALQALHAQAAFALQRRYGVATAIPQAQSHLDRAAAGNPEHPEVRKARAASELLGGGSQAAVQALAPLASDDRAAGHLLAEAHLAAGDPDAALKVVDAIVAAASNDAHALHLRGLALAEKGSTTQAQAAFAAALEAQPRYAAAAVEMGRLALEAGDADQARRHLGAALAPEAVRGIGGTVLGQAHQLLGEALLQLDQREEAIAAFDAAIEADGKARAPRLARAGLHLAAGEAQPAVKLLQPLVTKGKPPAADLAQLLVRAHLAAQQIEEAEKIATSLQEAEPEAAASAFVAGLVAQARGDAAAAEQAFRDAVKRAPEDGRAHAALIRTLHQAGKTDEAKAAAATAGEGLADDPEVAVAAGELHLASGDAQAALDAFDAAIAAEVEGGQAHLGRARALEALGDLAGAEAAWRDLVQEEDTAAHRLGLGTNLWLQGEHEDALEALEIAHEKAPEDPAILVRLARVHLDAGDEAEALQTIEQALHLDRENASAQLELSRIQLARGDATAAVRAARRAIALDGEKAAHAYQLGLALQAANVPLDALEAFRQAAELDPAAADPWERQGDLLIALNAGRDAARAYEKALELDPERTRLLLAIADTQAQSNDWDAVIAILGRAQRAGLEGVHLRLGVAWQQKGAAARSIRYFRDAAREDPADGKPWRQLGYAYKATGRIPDAVQAFRSYLEKSPSADDRAEIEDEIATLRL